MRATTSETGRKAGAVLWTVQGLLAALFLFAGGMKLVMPIAALTAQSPLPGAFSRLVGVVELVGALGLVLPGLLHLRRALAPLAAIGLVLVMCGAVGATLATGQVAGAVVPVLVGCLLAGVAYGRALVAPHRAAAPRRRAVALRPAF
jgi:hypothetical protein